MKKLFAMLALTITVWLAVPAQDIIIRKRKAAAGDGGGSSASDNFNRANGGLGSNWTQVWTFGSLGVLNDAVGSDGVAFWAGSGSFTDDQFSQVTVTTVLSGGTQGAGVRLSGTSFGTAKGYFCGSASSNVAGRYCLFKINSDSTFTVITDATGNPTVANGDSIKLSVTFSGGTNTLTCSRNGTNLTGLVGITDSSIGSGGKPGFATGTAIDDWSAGAP
jgi:hypothetical protein